MINYGDNTGRFYAQCKSDNNSEFVNRQKSVFEKLDAVVKDNEGILEKQNNLKRSFTIKDNKIHKRQRCDTRQFLGQESIFKRPEAPLPSRFKQNIPDFKRNPQKWTKYTLSDVSEEDMSDRSNTAAALSFLQEIKAKREAEEMDVDSHVKSIKFLKPSTAHRKQNTDISEQDKFESSIFRSSKVIMPEYVVGKKQMAKKNNNVRHFNEKREIHKEIKLDHLVEDDNDE